MGHDGFFHRRQYLSALQMAPILLHLPGHPTTATLMKQSTSPEIMLALRSPDSGWLGVLACVIDEACSDPRFDARQRELAMQLLRDGPLPETLMQAARQRAARFETELDQASRVAPPAPSRPKLTLVGSST